MTDFYTDPWASAANGSGGDYTMAPTTGSYDTGYDLGSGITNAGGTNTGLGTNVNSGIGSDSSWYNNPVDTSGSSGVNLGNLDYGQLAKLFGGVYGAVAGTQQGKQQQQIANQLLQNADPYIQYRQQAEIPFKLAQMMAYGGQQQNQTDLQNYIRSTIDAGNPQLDALKSKYTSYDPLGGDYKFYEDQLKNSYTDPLGVYNSQGYQKLADLFGQSIARRDAAAGRLSQYGDRANEMQGNFLKYLGDYRSGLNSSAGTAGQAQLGYYNAMGNGINTLGNQQINNLNSLTNLNNSLNSGLANLGNIVSADRTAGAGAAQAANMQALGSLYQNYALNPVIGAVTQTFGG